MLSEQCKKGSAVVGAWKKKVGIGFGRFFGRWLLWEMIFPK